MENREIKFRAWLKEEKKMANYISHFKSASDGVFEITVPFSDINSDIKLKDFRDFELMQFTGLKDKNGKEVYEGDIVRNNLGLITDVKWVKENLTYFPLSSIVRGNSNWDFRHEFEIIGNIYENPELLTK